MTMYAVYSDCQETPANYVVEGYHLERDKHKLTAAYTEQSERTTLSETRAMLDLSTFWLPQAAEKYKISSNLKDYIFVPVCIFASGLPNRNAIAFPKEKLLEFNADLGQMGYETWRRKGLFMDHVNKDITISNGTIFDSKIFPMRKAAGDLCKVILLAGWDRTKNPILANQIMTGERNNYSMGSWSSSFSCSICGHDYAKNKVNCEHITFNQPKTMKVIDSRLAYFNVGNVIGFELSSLRPTPKGTTNGAYHEFSVTPSDRVMQF